MFHPTLAILLERLLPIYRSSGYSRLDGMRGEARGEGGIKMKVMSKMTDISSVASLLQRGPQMLRVT